jgi:hypothetical protein
MDDFFDVFRGVLTRIRSGSMLPGVSQALANRWRKLRQSCRTTISSTACKAVPFLAKSTRGRPCCRQSNEKLITADCDEIFFSVFLAKSHRCVSTRMTDNVRLFSQRLRGWRTATEGTLVAEQRPRSVLASSAPGISSSGSFNREFRAKDTKGSALRCICTVKPLICLSRHPRTPPNGAAFES